MADIDGINTTLETHYRKDSGNLVSVLTKIFGPANLEMAEDVVQDAMVEALKQGRLFCKVCFCVSALCALQMCLIWCVGYME